MTILKKIKQTAPLIDSIGFVLVLVGPLILYSLSRWSLFANYGYYWLRNYKEIIIYGEADFFYSLDPSHKLMPVMFFAFDTCLIFSICLSILRIIFETIRLTVGQYNMKRESVEIYFQNYFNTKKIIFYVFIFTFLIVGYYGLLNLNPIPHDVIIRDFINKAPYMFISAQLFCFLTLNLFCSGIVPVLISDLCVFFRMRFSDT